MREPDIVQIAIDEYHTLQLAGISRDRAGVLRADGAIVNGTTRHVAPIALSDPDARTAWAERASAGTGLSTDTLLTSLLNAFSNAVAALQASGPADIGKAARVVELVENWTYFHDGPMAYVAIPNETAGTETLPLTSKAFRRRLSHVYHGETGDVLSGDVLGAAILRLEARAFEDGAERPVFIRVAGAVR